MTGGRVWRVLAPACSLAGAFGAGWALRALWARNAARREAEAMRRLALREEAVSAALHNGSRVDGDAVIRCTRGAGRGFGVRASDTALVLIDCQADFLHARNPPVPDHVVDAFVEEGVCGHMIVGDYRFAGDDVEHIVWTLRYLGTKNEVEAMQVEDAIRTLAGWTDGGKSFKRRPGLRQIGAARRVTNSR